MTTEQKDMRFLVQVGLIIGSLGGLALGTWVFLGGDHFALGEDVLIHGSGFHVNAKGCNYPKDKNDHGHSLTVVKARVISDLVASGVVNSAAVRDGSYEPKGGRFVKVRVLDGPFKDHLFYVPRGFIKP